MDANTTKDVSKAVKERDLESSTVGSTEWDTGGIFDAAIRNGKNNYEIHNVLQYPTCRH